MIMGRIVRKIRPTNYWRIGELESWFTDMAAKGLHLKKVGLFFTQFVKGEPKKTIYRIDIDFAFDGEINTDKKQLYAENGWDHVTHYSNCFHVFSSPDELDAPEIHTDPAEQAHTLEQLGKDLSGRAIGGIFLTIIAIGFFVYPWIINDTPILKLVKGIAPPIGMIVLTLFMVFNSIRSAVSINNLRKQLIEGKPINHSAPWKKHYLINSIINFTVIIIYLMTLILPYVTTGNLQYKTIPLDTSTVPFVRLAEIEQNQDLEYSEFIREYNSKEVNWDSRYNYYSTLFAPMIYDSFERGIVPNKKWEDGSGTYSPGVHSEVYKLRFKFLVNGLLNDLIKKQDFYLQRDGELIEIEHNEFDSLFIHKGSAVRVFASRGRAVMYVFYSGHADVDTLIEAIADKISLIAD